MQRMGKNSPTLLPALRERIPRHARPEHDARGMVTRDDKSFERSTRVFQHPNSPRPNLIAQEKNIIPLALDPLQFLLKRRQAARRGYISHTTHPPRLEWGGTCQSRRRHGKRKILINRVRHKTQA